MKVFIIDDNKDNADVLGAIIEDLGCIVELEYYPEKALPRILKFKPSMIFMDLLMPNINGFSLIREIKLHKSLFGIYIVAITGLDRNVFKELAITAGFDDYFIKPINLRLVEDIIDRRNKILA
jgi:CheY-like chemotaxis protein